MVKREGVMHIQIQFWIERENNKREGTESTLEPNSTGSNTHAHAPRALF